VATLARFYRIEPPAILVIYDDLDLPLGRIRLRPGGGAGGHNGMKSIIQALGVDGFPRLRVGIDRPPGRMDPADYVLQDFSRQQEEVMAQVRPQAVAACETWLVHGIEAAMNAFN
jgi:PTH1 family peptidyl-tRNA hydrolase